MRPDIILAVDTSAAHCAAALLCGDRVVTRVEIMAKGQAERLVPMLDELLASEGVTWADLGLLAVGVGPGNFTGIRISVALVRGLALGLNIPAIGVTGFEVLSSGAALPITVALPAPRGEVYVQEFLPEGPGLPRVEATPPAGARQLAEIDVEQFIRTIGTVARAKSALPQPRPAPFYLRGADAAPSSDPAPVILP